jgi:heme/copper-type cytochrome/quinol oxidase subunit 2
MFSFLIYLKNYFYNPWGQVGFKDPATSLMENIIDLHHFIFFFILIISGLVLWLLIQIIDNFIYLYNIRPQVINKKSKKYNTLDNFILFAFVLLASKTLNSKKTNI